MQHATRERFNQLCERLGVPSDHVESGWKEISKRYAESHRFYHNLNHIEFLIREYDECHLSSDEIELAIWFHDIVYDPRSKTNEEDSAEQFTSWAAAFLSEATLESVKALILATDPSRPRSAEADEILITDLDLLILSSEPTEYGVYKEAIRQEYSFVSDKDYAEGRVDVLQSLLNNRIYRSNKFIGHTDRANKNIVDEILELLSD